ncbi:hypothetical protein V6Z11_A11G263300 [Gossypium hirsutum]
MAYFSCFFNRDPTFYSLVGFERSGGTMTAPLFCVIHTSLINVRPYWKNKIEHITTYLHRPRTTRSPLSFWGDEGIVPFEPFYVFSRGPDKFAISKIFLILPSRKEEREILFPFCKDQEIRASLKKNAWLINNSLLGLRPPQLL